MEDRMKFEMALARVRDRLQTSGQKVPTFRDLLNLAQEEMDRDELRLQERIRAAKKLPTPQA
jgi:hypothetical protein